MISTISFRLHPIIIFLLVNRKVITIFLNCKYKIARNLLDIILVNITLYYILFCFLHKLIFLLYTDSINHSSVAFGFDSGFDQFSGKLKK